MVHTNKGPKVASLVEPNCVSHLTGVAVDVEECLVVASAKGVADFATGAHILVRARSPFINVDGVGREDRLVILLVRVERHVFSLPQEKGSVVGCREQCTATSVTQKVVRYHRKLLSNRGSHFMTKEVSGSVTQQAVF